MIVVNAVPGPELRAQLVGLGTIPALRQVTKLPPILQKQIQEAAAQGPSVSGGSGTNTDADLPTTTPAPEEGTNWLLWGGVAAGVVLLGVLFARR